MKKMLIVEHDADMIRYLNLAAARFGCIVVVAETPAEVEEALERESFVFAVVSRALFGKEFKKKLARIAEKIGGANVVVVCDDDFEETARITADQGVRACLTTPFEVVFIPDIFDEVFVTSVEDGTDVEGTIAGPEEDEQP